MAERDEKLGFLALPDPPLGDGCPGVVLVHDVWGLGDHARDLARRLASEGFAVLAIDLYRRLERVEIRDPGAWMRGLSDPQVLGDIREGVALLASLEETARRRVGVVGFCMGGTYALLAGCGVEGVGAVVPFYGLLAHGHGLLHDPDGLDPKLKPREPLAAAVELGCPLLGFFGGRDPYVPLEDVRALEQRLAESGQPSEIVVYPEAGHAFVNDTRPDAYREADARDAWARMCSFLGERL